MILNHLNHSIKSIGEQLYSGISKIGKNASSFLNQIGSKFLSICSWTKSKIISTNMADRSIEVISPKPQFKKNFESKSFLAVLNHTLFNSQTAPKLSDAAPSSRVEEIELQDIPRRAPLIAESRAVPVAHQASEAVRRPNIVIPEDPEHEEVLPPTPPFNSRIRIPGENAIQMQHVPLPSSPIDGFESARSGSSTPHFEAPAEAATAEAAAVDDRRFVRIATAVAGVAFMALSYLNG